MCTVAPFTLPAGCFGAVAAPPPTPLCVYDDDAAVEMEGLLGNIHDFVHQPTPPAGLVTSRPMPSAEFLALSTSRLQDNDAVDLEVLLRGIKRIQVVTATRGFAAPLAAVAAHDDDTAPTTPVAVLRAPFSYGDDDGACCTGSVINTKTEAASTNKKRPDQEPNWTYDANIDATFRKMEKEPAERPSEGYLWTTQEGTMTMVDRAELVAWMYEFSRFRGLPPGTLHRALNYVDRFLSAKKILGGDRLLLGATAVFAASKYEDSRTKWILNADDVARDVGGGCTRRQVLDAERDLVATLGYRLSGPTAYSFVDHFTRHDDQAVRSLAHHLADITLLDYRCAPFLPSAVAASAILLARRVVDSCFFVPQPQRLTKEKELLEMTRYTLEDLTDIIDVIYEMHELEVVWPGCALMMANCAYPYTLPPRCC